jgi:hypothetical protein
MTRAEMIAPADASPGRRWQKHEWPVVLRGVSHKLRLVSWQRGWLASVDSVEGPTLGMDPSIYLAVSRAVEPLGGTLTDAMSIIGELPTGAPASVLCERQLATWDRTQNRGQGLSFSIISRPLEA